MAHKSDFDKYYYYMTIIGAAVMAFNLYYYCRPLIPGNGMVISLMDSLVLRMRSSGMFASPLATKGVGLVFLAFSVITRGGKAKSTPMWEIALMLAAGTVLFVIPFISPVLYLVTTLAGTVAICWGCALLGRLSSFSNADLNDRKETFAQCEELIETPDSVNFPTRYFHQGRWHDGWVNCLAPNRGTIVMGVPGSGKSYSIFEPMMEQMIAKGYTMFVYDYKYPTLTEAVYNDLLRHRDAYKVKPQFCVVNFENPRFSLRCNPVSPSVITDPSDTTEIAELVMLNINKNAVEKEDFFTQSGKQILDGVLLFLRYYENGRYCTFAHAIQFMSEDYRKTLYIMSHSDVPGLEFKIKSFVNAMEGGAQDQLQGQIASAQIPLAKFISPQLYWVLTGDDFSLDINNPKSPKILCVGNNPKRQAIYGTTLALICSRLFKSINEKGRERCGVILDEFPTIYLKGVDTIIDTGRSNGLCVVVGCQDESQVIRDYTEKEAKVLFNTVGNTFSGQVNGQTAENLSKMMGKIFKRRESQTQGLDSDSLNVSYQQEDMVPRSNIETLSQGVFLGKVADVYGKELDEKFFCAKFIVDQDEYKAKKKAWQSLPLMTDFGEQGIREQVSAEPDRYLSEHFRDSLVKDGKVVYDEDALREKASSMAASLSSSERRKLLEAIVDKKIDESVDRMVQENFMRVQEDIKGILRREYDEPMALIKKDKKGAKSVDSRLVDPFAE